MSGAWYNGYSWKERSKILLELKRRSLAGDAPCPKSPCEMCGDPEFANNAWHSEDYSLPYSFERPANYKLCKPCHGRLHKRFKEPPENWLLFLAHLDSGGYSREYCRLYSNNERVNMSAQIAGGWLPNLPFIRKKSVNSEWYKNLSLDKESLIAAWARPRTFRPRPTYEEYRKAIFEVGPSENEMSLLRYHSKAPRRSSNMGDLASVVYNKNDPRLANLIYGKFAKKIAVNLNWQPDLRKDGTKIWMTVFAEGWQPDGRDFEWVQIPQVAKLFA